MSGDIRSSDSEDVSDSSESATILTNGNLEKPNKRENANTVNHSR